MIASENNRPTRNRPMPPVRRRFVCVWGCMPSRRAVSPVDIGSAVLTADLFGLLSSGEQVGGKQLGIVLTEEWWSEPHRELLVAVDDR